MGQEQCDLMTGEVTVISDFSSLFEGTGETKLAEELSYSYKSFSTGN